MRRLLLIVGFLPLLGALPAEEIDLSTFPRPTLFVEHFDGYRNVLVMALWEDGTALRLRDPRRSGSRYRIGRLEPDAVERLWDVIETNLAASKTEEVLNPFEEGGYSRVLWIPLEGDFEHCGYQGRFRWAKCGAIVGTAIDMPMQEARPVRLRSVKRWHTGLWLYPLSPPNN